ncbi:hypothetical protein CPB84DRAFT_1803614 [Gymnopilus junonius]|uniref:Uncharacterized protein n=1 Tax=Gymnopilus junonius TaxID=109634 RepID=A0A9P5N6R5_GYMJU|nr:hypothetical protein CPB84DRAFT_1803614 [Gymnopilus junonius]
MDFYSTDFNIYGPGNKGISLNYSLDSSLTLQSGIINSDGRTGKNGVNFWNLQGLDSAVFHSIKVIPSGGAFVLDYITYTPMQSTTLAGQNLIMDNTDQSIHYSGTWNKMTTDFPVGVPYLGTMSGSSKQGSNATFTFTGSSVSVYGLVNQQAGKLSAFFSVDGGATTAYTPFNGMQNTNVSSWVLSQQFYHQDLQPGSYTLAIQLEEVTGNQILWIDSVIYMGSVNTQTTQANNAKSGSVHLSPGIIAAISVLGFLGLLGCFTQRKRVSHLITTYRMVHVPVVVRETYLV